jgi:hypothetical protein
VIVNSNNILFGQVRMNDLENLFKQLNLIVGFLDVSDEDVYNQIKNHDRFNLGVSIEDLYENSFENYRNHITTSALILGISHFEDYITKIIAKLLVMMPSSNKIKVSISTFQECGNDYLRILGNKQARKLTFSEKIIFIRKTYSDSDTSQISEILNVNKIRNCLIHNNGYADERLSPNFSKGEKMALQVFAYMRFCILRNMYS